MHTASTTLGVTFRDRVTGFRGVCTAHIANLTGCDQVCLQPAVDADGKVPESRWFDVTRLEETGAPRITIPGAATHPGADASVLRAPGLRA